MTNEDRPAGWHSRALLPRSDSIIEYNYLQKWSSCLHMSSEAEGVSTSPPVYSPWNSALNTPTPGLWTLAASAHGTHASLHLEHCLRFAVSMVQSGGPRVQLYYPLLSSPHSPSLWPTSSFVFLGKERNGLFVLKIDKKLVAVEATSFRWRGRQVVCRLKKRGGVSHI